MGQAWQWWYVMYNFVHICAQLFRMTIFHWIEAAATACCKHSPLLRQCVLWLWMQGCTLFTLLWDCSKNILLCWAHLDTKKQNIFLAFHFLFLACFKVTEWIKVRWVTIMVTWKTAASKLTSQLKYYYSWIFYFWFFIQCKENRHYFVCPSVANPNTYFSYTCFYISNNYCWNLQSNFMWKYQRIPFIFGRTLLDVQFSKIAKQQKILDRKFDCYIRRTKRFGRILNMYLRKVKFFGHDDLDIKS